MPAVESTARAERVASRSMRLRLPSILVLLLSSCGPASEPSSPSAQPLPVDLSPPSASASAVTPDAEAACPELLRVLEAIERDCPIAAPAGPAFESCAVSIDRVGKSSKPGYIQDSAELVGQALRAMLDPRAKEEAFVELSRRRRAFAHGALRAHCGVGRHREQSEAWNREAEAVFLSLQPVQSLCARAANEFRPLTPDETSGLHVDVRMFVEADGSTTLASPLQAFPTMRADIAMCVLQTFEKVRFPPPEGRALLRTNVTFSRNVK